MWLFRTVGLLLLIRIFFDKIQASMKRNKKAPAMHRSEDDYILTTHIFCGKYGAMITASLSLSIIKISPKSLALMK